MNKRLFGLRFFLALPGILAAAVWPAEHIGPVVASIGGAAAVLVLLNRVGRWAGFIVLWLIWFFCGIVLVAAYPSWRVAIAVFLILMVVSYAAARLGCVWGAERAARLRAKGRGIREAEWVFTGSDYVAGHPLNRLSFGLWATVGILGLCALSVVAGVVLQPYVWAQAALGLVFVLPIWPILARQPVAYPLVIGTFVAACLSQSLALIAILAPVLIYWLDGVRPNLIYRHRFERLVPEGGAHVS